MSRVASFVRAARALLWMQVATGVLATGLGIWAVVAVRDLAAERDALLVQIAGMQRGEADAGPTASPTGVAPSPLDTEVRPPAIMPVFVPIVTDPAVTPPIPPVNPPPPPNEPAADPPRADPVPTDCNSPNADPRRCRPGVRWPRRDPPTVTVPPAPTAQPARETEAARPK